MTGTHVPVSEYWFHMYIHQCVLVVISVDRREDNIGPVLRLKMPICGLSKASGVILPNRNSCVTHSIPRLATRENTSPHVLGTQFPG